MKENWEKYTEWFTLVFFNIAIPFSQVYCELSQLPTHTSTKILVAPNVWQGTFTQSLRKFFFKGGGVSRRTEMGVN